MSADELRQAVKLMRERALAATPGPWWCDESDESWRLHGVRAVIPEVPWPGGSDGVMIPAQIMNHQILKAPKKGTPYAEYWPGPADAAQITSWHPVVALAVADWLEQVADDDARPPCDSPAGVCNHCERRWDLVIADRVAREYLGVTR